MKHPLSIFLFLILLISCKKESKTIPEDILTETNTDTLSKKEIEITLRDTTTFNIPQKLLSTIQKEYEGKNFSIINVALGKIDYDDTEDAAVIIQTTTAQKISESVLIYQNRSDSYRLMAQNRSIITQEYYFTDEHTNSSKEITIENNHLLLSLFCYGPCGNTFLDFALENDELVLTNFSTYDVGAGTHIERDYNVVQGIVKISTTNTMLDEMPVTEEEFEFTYTKGVRFLDLNTKSLFSELSEIESKTIL